MSVPLDNLYYWIEGFLPYPACLYVFRPHGSKKISDCKPLITYDVHDTWKRPSIICNDQEPLDWNYYNDTEQYLQHWNQNAGRNHGAWLDTQSKKVYFEYLCNFNLRSVTIFQSIVHDRVILLHSEENSLDLEQYQKSGFICVHYWSHAVIARDWYRFAQHDLRLSAQSDSKNKFLIHCRDWSHRREYRLKFLEMLVDNDLYKHSKTSVMHTNSEGVHFSQYTFENPKFSLCCPELLEKIPTNDFSSSASADYDYLDYQESDISVILETVFDDSRIHLTEKTLRPIACGHPFMLLAGPGSLEYIRRYGFKTFSPWIDESYDLETDSFRRMQKVIDSMQKIQNLQGQEKENFSRAIKAIADHNKKHFFSDLFLKTLSHELQTNLQLACFDVAKSRGKHWLEFLQQIKRHKVKFPSVRHKITSFVRQLRRSYPYDRSNPPEDPIV